MTLKERIKLDLSRSVYGSNYQEDLRTIMGEIQRLPTKSPIDEDVIKILITLRNKGKEFLSALNQQKLSIIDTDTYQTVSRARKYIETLNNYLPEEKVKMTEKELVQWISENIDFTQLRNKMESIKFIKSSIGNQVDGETIKRIIMEEF